MRGALAGSAHVLLTTEKGQFARDMTSAERQFLRSMGAIDDQGRRTASSIRRSFLLIGGGILGSIGGAYLLGRAFRAAWEDMMQGQRVGAQTRAVLESTGYAANVTADDVERLGEKWMRLSGVDDEIVKHGANVLLTFRGIRNELGEGNKIFDQSVEQLLNMAFVLQEVGSEGSSSMDALQATAIRLGKALNDPVRGVTALRRVGVQFTRDEEKQIKALVESGRELEAKKIILRELQAEFGNSARAAGETFPQALERLRNTTSDLAAEYLNALVPSMQAGSEWLQQLIDDFADNEEAQAAFREEVQQVVETVADLARDANDVAQALGGWENVIKALIALKFAKFLLEWTVLMGRYRDVTKSAAVWTAALGAAQGGLGAGGALKALGSLRGLLTGTAIAGLSVTGTVAVGTTAAVLATPNTSGAGEGTRRAQKKALLDGEYADEYPWLTIGFGMAVRGDASPKVLKVIKSMGEPPWSEGKMASADRQLQRLLDTGGRGRGPQPGPRSRKPGTRGADALEPTTELSIETQTQLARAERSGNEAGILRALHRADQEYTKLLRQVTLSDEERLALIQQQGSVRNQIRSIEEGNAAEAKRAAEERKRQQEQAAKDRAEETRRQKELRHTTRVNALERKLDRATETETLRDDIRGLSDLVVYYKRYRDTFRRGSQEWIEANEDVKDAQARLAGARATQRQQREGLKLWRLERARRLAEETEGVTDDLRALKNLRAHWIQQRREADKYSQAWRDAQDRVDEINAAIRDAKRTNRDRASSRSGLRMVQDFLDLQAQYGPNFFPDGSFRFPSAGGVDTSNAQAAKQAVTIVQEFPQAPTDYFREARYAQAAAAAVFDG